MSDPTADELRQHLLDGKTRINREGDPDALIKPDGDWLWLFPALDAHCRAGRLPKAWVSWDTLRHVLDTAYPEDVFPTREDDPERDTGPRIVSLCRRIAALEAERDQLHCLLQSVLHDVIEWENATELSVLCDRHRNLHREDECGRPYGRPRQEGAEGGRR